jgi:hypothetical protein
VPCQDANGNSLVGNTSTTPVSVRADASGLTAGQTYHFRLVASNSGGTSDGSDQLFGPPLVSLTGAGRPTPTTATLSASINPQNVDTTYHFEYGTTTDYGTSLPVSDADIGASDTPVQVSQDLTGLSPSTTYHFRVVATNGDDVTDGPDQTFATTPPALIDVQPPTGMSDSTGLATGSATLHAYIDPQGSDASYQFEYGTTTGYGNSTPAADAGSGNGPVAVSAQIAGLAANTTFHYRTVVSNGYGSYDGPDTTFTTPPASCPNAALRTGLSAGLPDCRAYEQVSPQDKGGYGVQNPDLAGDGSRAVFTSLGVFAGAPSDNTINHYLAVRSSSGWQTQSLDPPSSLGFATPFATQNGSDDLGTFYGVLAQAPNVGNAFSNATSVRVYRWGGDGTYTPVTDTLSTTNGLPVQAGSRVFGSSADQSTVVFETSQPLTPDDTTSGRHHLYDVSGANTSSPQLHFVALDNSGNAIRSCQTSGRAPVGAALGSSSYGGGSIDHAISEDGRTIFFTIDDGSPNCTSNLHLFARLDNNQTVDVSDPSPNANCTTPACQALPQGPSAPDTFFVGASADGSKAFFLSGGQLTNDATNDPGINSTSSGCSDVTNVSGCNLYEYDFNAPAGHNLVDLSAGDTSGVGPQVHFAPVVSDDGSHVYFTAGGVLSSAPNQLGQTAESGAENLFLANTSTGTVSFIAMLCTGQGASATVGGLAQCPAAHTDLAGASNQDPEALGTPDFDATPDGRYLVFSSFGQLTPDDTNSAADVYQYDAVTGSLVRLSVGHDGQEGNGNAGSGNAVSNLPLGSLEREQHVVSSDGQTVVFTSSRPLQTNAVNGQPDAYEWHDGEVSLISGTDSSQPVQNVTISPSGQDIMFATDQGLLPSDTDGLRDVYDARLDGGFAPAPTSPAPCSGDACQGPSSGAPPAPSGGTVTFSGPPNQTPSGSRGRRARVVTRTVHGNAFTLTVRVPGKGRITVRGSEVRRAGGFARHAGRYRVRTVLTGAARRALAHRHRLRLRLRVGWAPPGARAESVSFSILVRR